MFRLNRISDQMNCVDFRMEKVKCGWNFSYKVSSNEGHNIGVGLAGREALHRVGLAVRKELQSGRLCR